MKNKSFIFIIIISVAVFIGLLFSVYKITTNNKIAFYLDGYVSLSDNEKSEKVYFKEGTSYKKGYNDEIIFKDKNDMKQEISKYSFVYYSDKSINFLNDGVIMDLNSVNNTFIPYYNIKSNYLLKYTNGKYVIDTTDKDIELNNFIGRISDEKYIIAGNELKLKLSSSEKYVENYYFELIFKDGNIVKIDNDKTNLETISSECYILIGDDIKIDLSNKNILYKNKEVLSLNEIIIDNDENINIPYNDPNGTGGGGAGENNTTNNTIGSGGNNNTINSNTNTNSNTNLTNNTTNNTIKKPDPIYSIETVIETKNVPYVELVNSSVTSHKIEVDFNVLDIDKLITGPIKVTLLNIDTLKTVDTKTINSYTNPVSFVSDNLTSDTGYMLTVSSSYKRGDFINNNYVMFQKKFTTNDLGIDFEIDYVSSNELSFLLNFSDISNFTGGKLKLYDENNVIVATNIFTRNKAVNKINIVFSEDSEGNELKSNTKYIARVEDLVEGIVEYTSNNESPIEITQTTLKQNPLKEFNQSPIFMANEKDYTFTIDISNLIDKDNTIKKVTYNIYSRVTDPETNVNTDSLVKTIEKETVNSFDIEAGKDKELKPKTNYFYRAFITLYDNEKYIETSTLDSNVDGLEFKSAPHATFFKDDITAGTIKGYYVINDEDNAIDTSKEIYVDYYNGKGNSGKAILAYTTCRNEEKSTTKCAELSINSLEPSSLYTFTLIGYADYLDDDNENSKTTIINEFSDKTSKADVIITNYIPNDNMTDAEAIDKIFEFDLGLSINPEVNPNILDDLSFTINLYETDALPENYISKIDMSSDDLDIKATFFDGNTKKFTIADFGYSLEKLQERAAFKNKSISGTYAFEITSGSSNGTEVIFKEKVYYFDINEILLDLSENSAEIALETISYNSALAPAKSNPLLEDTTVAGLKVSTNFPSKSYAKSINYAIKDVTLGNQTVLSLKKDVSLTNSSKVPDLVILFDDYPDKLQRGHKYTAEYTVNMDLGNDGTIDYVYPRDSTDATIPRPKVSTVVEVLKQAPSMVLFPWTSDTGEITYKYDIIDIDSSLEDDSNVYYKIGTIENEALFLNNCQKYNQDTKAIMNDTAAKYKCLKFSGLVDKDNYSVYLKPTLLVNEDPTIIDINTFEYESIINNLNNISYNGLVTGENNYSQFNNMFVIKLGSTDNYSLNKIAGFNATIELTDTPSTYFKIDNITDRTGDTSFSGENYAKSASNMIYYYYNNNLKSTWLDTSSTQNDGNALLAKTAYVASCGEDEMCIYIDYSKLYNSKLYGPAFTDLFKNKPLTIKINALYDTGKIGYMAYKKNKYAYQVRSLSDDNNEKYLLTRGKVMSVSTFSDSALSGIYGYVMNSSIQGSSGMVDDGDIINKGNMTFSNLIYSNYSLTSNSKNVFTSSYKITKEGVLVDYLPGQSFIVVAKELAEIPLNGVGNFAYEKVIPAFSAGLNQPIVNGVKLRPKVTGYMPNDIIDEYVGTSEEGKYLYIDVFSDEECTSLVKTIRIKDSGNSNQFYSQTGTIVNDKYVIKTPSDNGYIVQPNSISISGYNSSEQIDYIYDYKTGTITFSSNKYDDKTITVSYDVIIDKLDINTEYFYKAYMNFAFGGKTYLSSEINNNNYNDYVGEFKSLNPVNQSDLPVVLNDFEITSLDDYKTRYLTTNYTIKDIIGIDNISYQICNDDNTSCVNMNNNLACEDSYNNYGTTCFTKENGYTAKVVSDISRKSNYNFLFGTNYNVIMTLSIPTTNGNTTTVDMPALQKNVRDLVDPTFTVTKTSNFVSTTDNYYLLFTISTIDNDKVISKYGTNYNDGEYRVNLADINKNDITGTIKNKDGIDYSSKYQVLSANDISVASYGFLTANTGFNLIVNYTIYKNNASLSEENKEVTYSPNYILYTTNNYGVALGKTSFEITAEEAILKFTYGTNILRDINNDSQAFVGGISYKIYREQGEGANLDSTYKLFDDGEIKYINGDSNSGEYYYKISLPIGTDLEIKDKTEYIIEYNLLITTAEDMIEDMTETKCINKRGFSAYWDNIKHACYVMSVDYMNSDKYERPVL